MGPNVDRLRKEGGRSGILKAQEELAHAKQMQQRALLTAKASWVGVRQERSKLLKTQVMGDQHTHKALLEIVKILDACTETETKSRCSSQTFMNLMGMCTNFSQTLARACAQNYQRLYHMQFKRWDWLMELAEEKHVYVPACYSHRVRDVDIFPGNESWKKAGLSSTERANKWKDLLLDNEIDPLEFAQAVYDWLEEVDYKRNSILIWGAISTGKTLFANSIRGCFLHRQLSNTTTTGNFAFGNCCHTHVIIYEEPFLHPTLADDIKNIAGGAELTCDSKYQVQQPLSRTPVLFTSNPLLLGRGHLPTQTEQALQARMHIFNFEKPKSNDKFKFYPIDIAFFLCLYKNKIIKQ